MTRRTATLDNPTPVETATNAVTAATTRIDIADQDVNATTAHRDKLLDQLRTDDASVSSVELGAADAAVRRSEAIALAVRQRLPIAEANLAAAVRTTLLGEAGRLAAAAPGALAELRAARTAATTAAATVTLLETAYRTAAKEMGERLQAAATPRVNAASAEAGWVGREEPLTVLGFNVGGTAVLDYLTA